MRNKKVLDRPASAITYQNKQGRKMKSQFDVMTKVPLEKYFVDFLEPKLKSGDLKNSSDIDGGLSLREHLGLVLLSYFLSELNKCPHVPAINNKDESDDGAIANLRDNTFYSVEQTFIYSKSWDGNVVSGFKDVLSKKQNKGKVYSNDLWLLIYCGADGNFNPDDIKGLIKETFFKSIIAFGQTGNKPYSYYTYLIKDGGVQRNVLFKLTIGVNGKAKLTNE